jgi:hypothetical protein
MLDHRGDWAADRERYRTDANAVLVPACWPPIINPNLESRTRLRAASTLVVA